MQKRFTSDDKKVRDHCHFTGKYREAAHSRCNMNYKISKNIPVIFHNGSTKEFEGQLECFGENTEKCITFSVPVNKEITKIDKDDNDKIVNVSYKLKFIDSFIFMSISLSSFVDNLSD